MQIVGTIAAKKVETNQQGFENAHTLAGNFHVHYLLSNTGIKIPAVAFSNQWFRLTFRDESSDPKLEELQYRFEETNDDQGDLESVTNLFEVAEASAARMPNLFDGKLDKSITESGGSQLTDQMVSSGIIPPNTTILDIPNATNLSGFAVIFFPTSLTYLNMENNTKLSDTAIPQLPRYLLHLQLSMNPNFTDRCIKHLPRKLTYLNLSKSTRLTDNCIGHLPRSLLHLDLKYNTNLTEKCLIKLPPNLTYLDISKNHNITKKQLRRVWGQINAGNDTTTDGNLISINTSEGIQQLPIRGQKPAKTDVKPKEKPLGHPQPTSSQLSSNDPSSSSSSSTATTIKADVVGGPTPDLPFCSVPDNYVPGFYPEPDVSEDNEADSSSFEQIVPSQAPSIIDHIPCQIYKSGIFGSSWKPVYVSIDGTFINIYKLQTDRMPSASHDLTNASVTSKDGKDGITVLKMIFKRGKDFTKVLLRSVDMIHLEPVVMKICSNRQPSSSSNQNLASSSSSSATTATATPTPPTATNNHHVTRTPKKLNPVICYINPRKTSADYSTILKIPRNVNHVTLLHDSQLGSLKGLPPSVTYLKLRGPKIQEFSDLPKTLSHLQMDGNVLSVDKDLKHLPSTLTYLSLHSNRRITSNGLSLLPKTITHLDLSFANISGAGLKDLPPNLLHLILENNKVITDSDIPLLPRTITDLNLKYNLKLTDSMVQDLPPYLQIFQVGGSALTDRCVPMLPRSLTQLEVLRNDKWTNYSIPHLPPNLTIFCLQSNTWLTNVCVRDLPRTLVKLDLHSSKITAESISQLPPALKWLRSRIDESQFEARKRKIKLVTR